MSAKDHRNWALAMQARTISIQRWIGCSSAKKVHSFKTLIQCLGTICKNVCRIKGGSSSPTFTLTTVPDDFQAKALEMLKVYPVPNVDN